MMTIEVTARFDLDGSIQPLQFTWQGSEYRVQATGRQWQASDGRHILVMTQGERMFELVFAVQECRWFLYQHSSNDMTS